MEQYENCERNVEKDKQAFIEAVNSISIEEILTDYDAESVRKLSDSLNDTKLFLLGEMHGVKENVDIIYSLFKKFGFRQLALEWEPYLKEVADKFVETGLIDFDAIQNSPDGRITAGHFALIKKLKDEGLLENLICFDHGSMGLGWDARDGNMAKNILANLSNSDILTLVVAGNLHTKVEQVIFKGESEAHHPMGERVKEKIPNVPSGKIQYLKGKYHNYGVNDFFELESDKRPVDQGLYLSEDGLYTCVVPEAHLAIVPDPDEKLK